MRLNCHPETLRDLTVGNRCRYSALSVLRNTMVGLRQVDASVIESARGMGMTKTAVLTRIELPLAVLIIMAGLRTSRR